MINSSLSDKKSNLTLEQQAVVDCDFKNILIVNAYAGTGKTSTLVQFCEARKNDKILYLSYNSSMRAEAEKKFKHIKNVEVKTMHSLAYTELKINEKYKERLGSIRAMDLYPILSDIQEDFQNFYAMIILKLTRAFCNTNLNLRDFKAIVIENPEEFDINPRIKLEYALDKMMFLWEDLQDEKSIFAYEHDFYLKVYQLNKIKLQYDYILVDEAQDINACVIDVVLNQTHAKKVFIGDTYQSIYRFRGAVNSLEILSKQEDVKILYLTQSFRCPQNIAKIANLYLSLLNAPREFKGTTRTKQESKTPKAIVCRTNAMLFDIAVNNLDKKLFLVGGVSSYNFDDLLDIQNLLFKKHKFIKNSFIARFSDIKELMKYIEETQEIDLKQKIMILFKYIESDIRKLIKDIEKQSVKNQDKADLILSTGHKSKGLEWDNVELSSDFLNVKEQLENEEKIVIAKEEINLLYVAITRAKNSLTMEKDYLLDKNFIDENLERIEIQ